MECAMSPCPARAPAMKQNSNCLQLYSRKLFYECAQCPLSSVFSRLLSSSAFHIRTNLLFAQAKCIRTFLELCDFGIACEMCSDERRAQTVVSVGIGRPSANYAIHNWRQKCCHWHRNRNENINDWRCHWHACVRSTSAVNTKSDNLSIFGLFLIGFSTARRSPTKQHKQNVSWHIWGSGWN